MNDSMKVGIMQPYFFPYIGYWQLMNAVDVYVIYDDVNYIKGGWINRNRILLDSEVTYLNLPILGASPNKKINEILVNKEKKLVKKMLKKIEYAYKKAPYFENVYLIIEQIMNSQEESVSEFLMNSFRLINQYLGIHTELILSSNLDKDCRLNAQDKILNICEVLGATEYYNAIGGRELYDFSVFKENGIQLKFLQTNKIRYKQHNDEFFENLSIIDVLMFNSKEEVQKMLNEYSLVETSYEKSSLN